MEASRGVKRSRTESSSSETDIAEISDNESLSSDDEDTDLIDLTSDDPSSPGTSNTIFVSSDSESETKNEAARGESHELVEVDESISIVYEKIRPTPDLHVELNKASNELVIDFFKRDCTPYYGHFSKKIKIGRKKVKLSVSVSIGDQSASKQNKDDSERETESGPSQAESTSESGSNQRYTVQCGICLDNLEEIFGSGRNLWSTMCGHVFCNVCVSRCQGNFKQCPTCCKKLTKKQYHPIYH